MVNNLHFSYNKESLLQDICFTLNSGDFTGLIGPNGVGKTTLLKLMSGIFKPCKGEVLLQNKNVKNIKRKHIAQKIGVVHQGLNINTHFTVEEFVSLGRYAYHKPFDILNNKDKEKTHRVLKKTNLWELKNSCLHKLSFGEKQRTYLAQTLAQEPDILLLDEPTNHLDISHQIQILDILKNMNQQKKTAIFVIMHDLNLASAYCNNIFMLKQGKILYQGAPRQVMTTEIIKEVFDLEKLPIRTGRDLKAPGTSYC